MVINFVIVINNESFIQNINFVYVVYKFKKLKFKFILSYDIYYKRIRYFFENILYVIIESMVCLK